MEFSRPGHHRGDGPYREEVEEYPPPSYGGPPPHAPPAYGGPPPHAPPAYGGPPPHAPPNYGGPSPPPPSYYGGNAPPPPQVTNVYHSSHTGGGAHHKYPPPPVSSDHYHHHPEPPPAYPPPQTDNYSSSSYSSPPSVVVQHVSHDSPQKKTENNPHHFRPHMPSIVHHHQHQEGSDLVAKPAVRVYSKAETNYSLAIRDGKVILARSDPSDPLQHWIKDEKYSTKVKDEQGYPSFALVNKATGQAMKHSIGATHPVQLIPYNSNQLDEAILWTESKDLGDSYRTIRMVNNIRLNVDAFNGDKNHGGVHDGTTIVLWEWKKGDNQRWKIVPY